MIEKHVFKPRAQLLLQLGDQLIKNENIAIIELIKNSYDADASFVNLTLNDIDNKLVGEIIIEDDGIGMTLDIVKNIWLEPGNAHKKEIIKKNNVTSKGRLPIGEKGIGRFGVHKLGKKISMITCSKDEKEIVVDIDWTMFNEAKYLEDVTIEINQREPEVFIGGKTGTKIHISDLNIDWNKDQYLELKRSVEHFNSPFELKTDFSVNLFSNLQGWDEKSLTFDDIKHLALYHYSADISANNKETFTYEFLPYTNMEVVGRVEKDTRDLTDSNGDGIFSGECNIGDIRFELYCFDRDSTILKKYLTADKQQFKKYLDSNGGISVFRDGLRIYDYGEPENDWLGLDHARLNQPASKISNNIIIGAVFLNRKESISLIEKSNREGFVENQAYREFKNAILESITNFLVYRNADKNRLRLRGVEKKEPILEEVKIIKQKIDMSNLDKKDKKEIMACLERMENDYVQIKEINLMTSSAGVSYGIVIHEIEKIIKELKLKVDFEETTVEFKDAIFHLADIIQNYSDLIRRRKKQNSSLLSTIKQSKFNCSYRLKAHEINFEIDEGFDTEINCSFNLVVGAILNIIDNSIWWLHKYKIKDKKIYAKISKYKKGYISLIIADNGYGFTIDTEDAIKPFVTQKNGGIGLGLNIVNEIMISHDGILDFPSFEDVGEIPDDYKNGAIVALCFKKE